MFLCESKRLVFMKNKMLLLFVLAFTALGNAQTGVNKASFTVDPKGIGNQEELGIFSLVINVSFNGGKEIELPMYEKVNVTLVEGNAYATKVMDELELKGIEVKGYGGNWSSYKELELEKKEMKQYRNKKENR